MEILGWGLFIVALMLGGAVCFAMTRPDEFLIHRELSIQARPDSIYPQLESFHQWVHWSPWEDLDLSMKRTHTGPEKGPGAGYAWEGNSKVGQGQMEIVEVTPNRRLQLKLTFLKPFKAENRVSFDLVPTGPATQVKWSMTGKNPFMMKVMGLFLNMDALVGKDFEKGLTRLKNWVENGVSTKPK